MRGKWTSMNRNKTIRKENQGQFTAGMLVSTLRKTFQFRSHSVFQINKSDIFISKTQNFCVFPDCRVEHS